MMKKITTKSGFTLLETIISLGVFAVGITALFSTQTLSIKGNAGASRITTLVNWGSHEVEQLLKEQYADVSDTDPVNIFGDGRYTVSRTVNADTPVTNVKQIVVTVASLSDDKKVILRYYKADENAK